jgi:hypothetical protein
VKEEYQYSETVFHAADKAPATLVSLIGKNQYTRCAKDIYYFSQVRYCQLGVVFVWTMGWERSWILDQALNVEEIGCFNLCIICSGIFWLWLVNISLTGEEWVAYWFVGGRTLQATVCMKQLAYSLLEMTLLATFPELHDLVLDVRSSVMWHASDTSYTLPARVVRHSHHIFKT